MNYSKHGYLRSWYFHMRYHKWFEHQNGIKGFAEQTMYWLITGVIKQSRKVLEKVKRLKLTKDKLITQKRELVKQPILNNDVYFSIHKKAIFTSVMVPILIAAETFLNYIATLVIFSQTGLAFILMRCVIAIVLTVSGIMVGDWFLEAISPVKADESPDRDTRHKRTKRLIRIIWTTVALLIVEFAIVGIAEYRARDVEGGVPGSLLYYSFIALAGALPLVIAYLRWDKSHYYDAYTNRRKLIDVDQELKTIDEQIANNQLNEHFNFKNKAQEHWAVLSEFRVYKENYNHKKGIKEYFNKHFAKDKKSFLKEAKWQYDDGLEHAQTIPHLVQPSQNGVEYQKTIHQ